MPNQQLSRYYGNRRATARTTFGKLVAKVGYKLARQMVNNLNKPKLKPMNNKNKKPFKYKKSVYVGRNQFTKYGLPSTYQKVSKPIRGNQYSAKGTMVKYKNKSKKVKSMRYRFNQTFRITNYLFNPHVSFIAGTGQIKTRDSVILEGSKTGHYKLLVFNASPVVTPALNKLGNQQISVNQPWIFESESDNTNLRRGFSDIRRNNPSDPSSWVSEQIGVSTNPAVSTISGIPYSGNSQSYVIPNMVQKAVNVNLDIELLGSLNSSVEVFFKIVRRTKPMKPNPDLSDKGTSDVTQAQLWEDVTKTICNSHITDKEMYQTVYLYHKKYKPSHFSKGIKKLHIKKLVKTMYNRTSSYMHSDLEDRSNIGEAILPNLDQHQDAIANQLFAVFGLRRLDDNIVSITQSNISSSSDIKDIQLADKINILPTQGSDNKFKIRGYITSVFGCRDLERNSSVHSSTITDLHTRLTALEADNTTHSNDSKMHDHTIPLTTSLVGRWYKYNVGNAEYFDIAFAPAGSSYQYTVTSQSGSVFSGNNEVDHFDLINHTATVQSTTFRYEYNSDTEMQYSSYKLIKQ